MEREFDVLTPEEVRAFGLRPIMGGDGEAVVPPVAVTPDEPPAYFKAHAEMVSGALKTMADNIGVLAGMQRPAVVMAVDTTDAEIEEALRTGTGAAAINKAIERGVAKGLAERVDPSMQAGLEAIQRMTEGFATGSVDPTTGKPKMPYYKRFEGEIKEVLSRLPAGTKILPETYQWAHDMVAGRHVGELTAEAVEQVNRAKASERPGSAGGALRSTRETPASGGANDIPSVAEFMGEEFAQTLEQMGRTPDGHAKSLGYADWSDYVKKAREIDGMLVASAEVPKGKGGRR